MVYAFMILSFQDLFIVLFQKLSQVHTSAWDFYFIYSFSSVLETIIFCNINKNLKPSYSYLKIFKFFKRLHTLGRFFLKIKFSVKNASEGDATLKIEKSSPKRSPGLIRAQTAHWKMRPCLKGAHWGHNGVHLGAKGRIGAQKGSPALTLKKKSVHQFEYKLKIAKQIEKELKMAQKGSWALKRVH